MQKSATYKSKSMKKITLFILVLTISIVNAQITVTGTVTDNTNTPIEFANVVLLNKENNDLVSGTITDEKGKFTIKTDKKGEFNLQISFIGFINFVKNVNSSIDLGSIILKSNNELDEVIINAKKPIIKREVDRLVFDVGSSTHTLGGELTDALRITPGVSIINDNVSIFGKSDVKLMLNGRITTIPSGGLMNFLSSIPADDIKTIEVITNPPARFEAEGNYGLINIIYKKRENFWSSRINSRYIQTTYPSYAGGGNLSYNKNKFSLFFDVNGKVGSEAVIEKSDINYSTQFWEGNTDRKDKKDYLSSRLSLQYDISEKINVGFQYMGGFENPDIEDNNLVRIFNQSSTIDSLIVSNGNNNRSNYNHSLNLYSEVKLDTLGRNLSITLDYFNYVEEQDRDFETKSLLENGNLANIFSSSNNTSKQDINNYSAKIDISHPINKLKLSYGGKISFIKNNNSISFFDLSSGLPVIDLNQSDDFDCNENTQAWYVSASQKLNNKWSLKFGLRFENSNTIGFSKTLNQTNKTNYNKIFPTAYVAFNPNKKNSYSLSYGKRIKRPKFWEINPFRWYVNNFTFAEGNPFLQPSFTDNYEFNHIYRSNFTTIAFLSITNNGFGQVPIVNDNTNILTLTRQNFYKNCSYGLGFVYKLSKVSWLSSFFHTQLYYSETKFNNNIDDSLIGSEQNGVAYTFTNYNSIVFNKNKTLLGELNFWYKSSQKKGLYLKEDYYSIDIGLRSFFLNKNLQASFNVYDILRTSNPNLITFYKNGITRVANVYNDNRYFKISLSYKFGNKKIRSRKRRVGNREEKKRI